MIMRVATKASSPRGLSYLTSRLMKSYLGNIFLLTQIVIYTLHRTYLILVFGSEILKFFPEPEMKFSTNIKMHQLVSSLKLSRFVFFDSPILPTHFPTASKGKCVFILGLLTKNAL